MGECIGAVSLLGGERRTRTVRALRDCELLRLDRQAFEALVAQHPHAMLGVARRRDRAAAGARTRSDRPGLPRTFAILPVDTSVPARVLAMQLAQALESRGSCRVIDADQGHGRGSDWFAEREAQSRFVIYLDSGGELWRQRCLRQADVLLLPAMAAQPARPWPEAGLLDPRRAGHRRGT